MGVNWIRYHITWMSQFNTVSYITICYFSCMLCTYGCDDRPWWSTVVLRQLHQLPVIEERRQRPSAVVTNHGSVQLATIEHRLYQSRLLHQHPQGTRVWIFYAGMFWYTCASYWYLFTVAVLLSTVFYIDCYCNKEFAVIEKSDWHVSSHIGFPISG